MSRPVMKTKEEIREKISELRSNIKGYPFIPKDQLSAYQEVVKAQIIALQWALGYKLKVHQWCLGCRKSHQGEECPICGGNNLLEPREEIPVVKE